LRGVLVRVHRRGPFSAAADCKISAIFGTVAFSENELSTVPRAAEPSCEVRARLPRNCSSLSTHSSSVLAKKPFTPSMTTSQLTPTSEATTGRRATG
jgi:hypothetical protein